LSARQYDLIELDGLLRRSGARAKCFKYLMDEGSSALCIVYHDHYFEERFLLVFRTSRLCYRIFYEGDLISKRTAKQTAEYLHVLLSDLITRCEKYKVMTVAEFNQYTGFTYSNKLDLFRRLEEKPVKPKRFR